ncbi:MAG: nucleotidyltransferase domain-containing protein [Bacteroidaceae bacterium]|nr:nucleotidyltransferase domain-containing protein [Bacteroidaceae bacterium]
MDADVQRILCDYFKTKPVEKAWVFGSFSRGEEKPGSDIDILVTLSPNSGLGLQFFKMIIDLENQLNRPVDLVVDGDLLPFAQESADIDKVLVYERAS